MGVRTCGIGGAAVAAGMIGVLALAGVARGQVTRTAAFENLALGSYGTNFTDPASGIHFRNSTIGGFDVNDGSPFFFGGTHYLTGGIIGAGGTGRGVGFTADLPQPASGVSVDVHHEGNQLGLLLQGFDAGGNKIAEAAQPAGVTNSTLSISAAGYAITTFRVVPQDLGGLGYDNVTYTVPEPAGALLVWVVAATAMVGRRRPPQRGDGKSGIPK